MELPEGFGDASRIPRIAAKKGKRHSGRFHVAAKR